MASDGNNDYSGTVAVFLTHKYGEFFQANSQLVSGKGCWKESVDDHKAAAVILCDSIENGYLRHLQNQGPLERCDRLNVRTLVNKLFMAESQLLPKFPLLK